MEACCVTFIVLRFRVSEGQINPIVASIARVLQGRGRRCFDERIALLEKVGVAPAVALQPHCLEREQ
jgi:hypothetical protein